MNNTEKELNNTEEEEVDLYQAYTDRMYELEKYIVDLLYLNDNIYFDFQGNTSECDEDCKGWDGFEGRCDCNNRRVAWEFEDYLDKDYEDMTLEEIKKIKCQIRNEDHTLFANKPSDYYDYFCDRETRRTVGYIEFYGEAY